METQLNDLQTSVGALTVSRRRQKNMKPSNIAACAGVDANGLAAPSEAETNGREEANKDMSTQKNNIDTVSTADSVSTFVEDASVEVAENDNNLSDEEDHSRADSSTNESEGEHEPKQIEHDLDNAASTSVGQTTPTEPHQLQNSETKFEPNMPRNIENKNSHGDVADQSSANENESDSHGNQHESVPNRNSSAMGYTRTEPLSDKPPPKISKPNFVVSSYRNQPSSSQMSRAYSNVSSQYLSEAHVIRQTEKAYLPGDESAWQSLSVKALNRAKERGATVHEDCVISVLCLDTSESMAGDAWNQVKKFTKDFLAGLTESKASAPHIRDEYVAVATFGHKTELRVLLTKNYEEVGRQIDGISLGGPTPLYGGLMMALAGAQSSENEIGPCINGIRAVPKIIVLTDGYPTELMLNAGPDIADESQMEQSMDQLTAAVQIIDGKAKSVFFVGVGKYNENFIRTMSSVTGPRRRYTYADGRRIARRHYLTSERESVGRPYHRPVNRSGPSEDEDDLQDVKDDYLRRIGRSRQQTDDTPQERESNNTTLPRVGTRVRRGPDWRWGSQDSDGPGTVVGHEIPGRLLVTWDLNGQTGVYNYDEDGYEVIPVDEPRRLNHGEKIAVGCTVTPGRGNKSADLKPWNTGVVLRLDGSTAQVRWDSGKRMSYKIGAGGNAEIEVRSGPVFQGQGNTLGGCSSAKNTNNSNSNSPNVGCNTSSATSVIKKNKNN